MTETSLSAAFEAACRRCADQVAMYEPSGAPVRFAGIFFTVAAFALALSEHGVRERDSVAVHVRDPIAGLALRLAALRLGTRVVAGQRGAEEVSAPVTWHLVAPDRASGRAGEIVVRPDWVRPPRRILPISGRGEMVKATSGTTGTPKLRLFTEAALLARVQRGIEMRGNAEGPALIGYAPGSSPGFNHALRLLINGCAQLHTLATPEATLAAMARAGVTTAYLSPFNFNALLQAAEADKSHRPPSLRSILVGGGAVTPMQAKRGEAVFGAVVINTYGSSETGSIAHHRPTLTPEQPGVVGSIYPDVAFRFVAEGGGPARPEEGGELFLKPPEGVVPLDVLTGRPVADEDGWIATGDIGRILPDGTLLLTGRKSELLNVGGSKKAPSVFEDIARDIPGVSDVAAFRAPQGSGMDHVGLALVPGAGFDPVLVRTALTERFGPLYPFEIIVKDRLPVTEAGKIDRRVLIAEFVGQKPPGT